MSIGTAGVQTGARGAESRAVGTPGVQAGRGRGGTRARLERWAFKPAPEEPNPGQLERPAFRPGAAGAEPVSVGTAGVQSGAWGAAWTPTAGDAERHQRRWPASGAARTLPWPAVRCFPPASHAQPRWLLHGLRGARPLPPDNVPESVATSDTWHEGRRGRPDDRPRPRDSEQIPARRHVVARGPCPILRPSRADPEAALVLPVLRSLRRTVEPRHQVLADPRAVLEPVA